MAEWVIEPGESLSYEHAPPSNDGAMNFVFMNPLIATPLTPNRAIWAEVAPIVAAEGYGALVYDYRGLGQSRAAPRTALEPGLLVSDLRGLLAQMVEGPTVLVGLGFGGLIAAGAALDGEPAAGLVLINGLIDVGARLEWVNAAAPLLAAEGGGGAADGRSSAIARRQRLPCNGAGGGSVVDRVSAPLRWRRAFEPVQKHRGSRLAITVGASCSADPCDHGASGSRFHGSRSRQSRVCASAGCARRSVGRRRAFAASRASTAIGAQLDSLRPGNRGPTCRSVRP